MRCLLHACFTLLFHENALSRDDNFAIAPLFSAVTSQFAYYQITVCCRDVTVYMRAFLNRRPYSLDAVSKAKLPEAVGINRAEG